MNSLFNYHTDDINKIIACEQRHHPEASLTDIYKLFFQSWWGQGHFINDIDTARKYLEQEVSAMNETYLPIAQDISNGKGLYRISLSIIKDRFISIDDYLCLFMDMNQMDINWKTWSEDWNNILSNIVSINPHIVNHSEIEYCRQVIKKKAIISHSECFRLTYKPHYRVMLLKDLKFSIEKTYKEKG